MSGMNTRIFWTGAGYYGGLQVDGQEGAEVRVYRGAPGTAPFYRHKPGSTLNRLAEELKALTYTYLKVRGAYEKDFVTTQILPKMQYSCGWDTCGRIRMWTRVRVTDLQIPYEWKHLLSVGLEVRGYVVDLKVQVPVGGSGWSAVVEAATKCHTAELAYEQAKLNPEFIKEDETHETIVLE